MPKIIDVRGPLISNDLKWIYDWFEMDATCPRDIAVALEKALETQDSLILRINSPGGYVNVGADIYEAIRSSDVEVEARIVGDCCSAATYIACASNKTTMSPLGQYMIHRSMVSGVDGNVNDFSSIVESLTETDKAIANAYALKTGMSQEEIIKLMDKTTWMNADTALSYGFVDEILFTVVKTSGGTPVNLGQINAVENHLIDENIIQEMMKNKSNILGQQRADFFNAQKAKARLNLLQLGGNIDE